MAFGLILVGVTAAQELEFSLGSGTLGLELGRGGFSVLASSQAAGLGWSRIWPLGPVGELNANLRAMAGSGYWLEGEVSAVAGPAALAARAGYHENQIWPQLEHEGGYFDGSMRYRYAARSLAVLEADLNSDYQEIELMSELRDPVGTFRVGLGYREAAHAVLEAQIYSGNLTVVATLYPGLVSGAALGLYDADTRLNLAVWPEELEIRLERGPLTAAVGYQEDFWGWLSYRFSF